MKILITGGTNGMGKGVAKVLAGTDNGIHEVIILCRSEERGNALISELESETRNKNLSLIICDLAKLGDVRSAAGEIHARYRFLDGIFINAGLGYAAGRVETEDGMDSHFQVNYLSQFMLTLNLLGLLEKSGNGGRVVFNVTKGGKVFWDDLQMKEQWGYVKGIRQAMLLKRMFYTRLHNLYSEISGPKVSFYGFQIPKTVWTNQVNIIPTTMKAMAGVMKFFGGFISIEECGKIMAPLFTETQEKCMKKSGKFITSKKDNFIELQDDDAVLSSEMQDNLWKISLSLCNDEKTSKIAEKLTARTV